MKTYSLTEIVNKKLEMLGKYRTTPLDYEGVTYSYFIIPAANGPKDLPNFVFRMTPTTAEIRAAKSPADVVLLGISSDVPRKVRNYPVLHEITEFVHLGIETRMRCGCASCKELELLFEDKFLKPQDKVEYMRMRAAFFQNLLAYALQHPASYTPEDIEEFRGSLKEFKKKLCSDAC